MIQWYSAVEGAAGKHTRDIRRASTRPPYEESHCRRVDRAPVQSGLMTKMALTAIGERPASFWKKRGKNLIVMPEASPEKKSSKPNPEKALVALKVHLRAKNKPFFLKKIQGVQTKSDGRFEFLI